MSDASQSPRVSVVIADDNADVRLIVREWLSREERFEVVGDAATGAEAIEAARLHRPDLVIMDVLMPHGSGEEATRIVQTVSPETLVIAYSALDDRSSIFSMLGAGVHGYVVKPADEDELVAAMTAVLDGGTYLSARVRTDMVDHVLASNDRSRTETDRQWNDRRLVERALEPGALQMAVQPIVDLRTGDHIGYEALARFRDRTGPSTVFEAAVRNGRGLELELAAARAAIEVARRLDAGHGFVSVNVSPETLLTGAFRDLVRDADPATTMIELTEKCVVADYDEINDVFQPLRDRGFRLAVDDVGGGFACLSHIHRLEPDMIKIDRYLVQELDTDPRRQAILSAMASIADAFDSLLVAEGVETLAELRVLQELGIEHGQGFVLGAPQPSHAVPLHPRSSARPPGSASARTDWPTST